MKIRFKRVICAMIFFALLATTVSEFSTAHAQGTAFTYQGRLIAGGSPANGTNYSLVFYLYDAPTGGNLLGNLGIASVTVSNGLFTVPLDFGAVFNGNPRWLEVSVEKTGPGGDSGFTTLAPRQQILATPYAIMAGSASNLVGSVSAAQLPTTVVTNGTRGVNLSGTFTGDGGGLTNLNASQISSGTLADAQLPGNVAFLNGNQSFDGTNQFTMPVILFSAAPTLRFFGPGGTGAQATLDLSTYNPGTNAPSARIQTSDNNWGSDWDFYGKQPGSNTNPLVSLMHISAGGNVGIGTVNPATALHVASSQTYAVGLLDSSSSAGTWLDLRNTSIGGTNWQVISTAAGNGEGAGKLLFSPGTQPGSSSGVNPLVLTSGGNVGIGTTTPTDRLSLGNDNAATKLAIWDGGTNSDMGFGVAPSRFLFHVADSANSFSFLNSPTGTEVMTIQGSGNVGIGTNNPQSKLQVMGDIQLGTGGTNFAANGIENLRLVRGLVDPTGNTLAGTGFYVHSNAVGDFTVSFTNAFAGLPAVTVSPALSDGSASIYGQLFTSRTTDWFAVHLRDTSGSLVNSYFEFIAVGPP